MKLTMSKMNVVNITIMITLFCTYIFPSGLIDFSIPSYNNKECGRDYLPRFYSIISFIEEF